VRQFGSAIRVNFGYGERARPAGHEFSRKDLKAGIEEQDLIFDIKNAGRIIEEIDQNAEIALDDETHGRTNDDDMFGVDDLAGEEVVMDTTTGEHVEQIIKDVEKEVSTAEPITTAGEVVTTTVKVSAAPTTDVTEDEIIMAQALARLKSEKPKIALDDETQGRTNDDDMFGVDLAGEEVVMDTTTVTTTTTVKVSVAPTTYVTEDEITMAQALAKLKSKNPKVVLQDQESTTIPTAAKTVTTVVTTPRAKCFKQEKGKNSLKYKRLVELIKKRKKHFAALRAQEKRNKPPTKAQMKSQMSTYLKHMGGYKQSHLKGMSFNEIKKLFDREMQKVNDFIAMDSKAQESSIKRTAEHLESNISKKQKVDENVKPVIDDTEDLKKCMEIVHDDGDEVLVEATPLSSKSPNIIDYKIYKEGKKTYFKIIRADGNSQVYLTFEKIFKNFNREDLEVLWAIVKDRFKKEKPVNDMDNLLFRTLKTMFEHHVEDTIWTYQQGLAKVIHHSEVFRGGSYTPQKIVEMGYDPPDEDKDFNKET
nr:hypothetical protein [Tanacetum cinerariifolium]